MPATDARVARPVFASIFSAFRGAGGQYFGPDDVFFQPPSLLRQTCLVCLDVKIADLHSSLFTFLAATGPMPMIRGYNAQPCPLSSLPLFHHYNGCCTIVDGGGVAHTPSFLNAGRSLPRASILEPALGPSSVSTIMVAFLFLPPPERSNASLLQ